MTAVLVFPVAPIEARNYFQSMQRQGGKVIAANSAAVAGLEHAALLPSIYEEDFFQKLNHLLEEEQVDTIYSSVTHVYHFLKSNQDQLPAHIQLTSGNTLDKVEAHYRDLIKRAQAISSDLRSSSTLTTLQIASLLQGFHNIFGESSEEKLVSLMRIFPYLPRGDVVEIGCLFGKSFFGLAALSFHYHIGPALAIDPWQTADSQQKDSPEFFQKLTTVWDWDLIAQAFIINLLPYKFYGISCLRQPSVVAANLYHQQRIFETPEFGRVSTSGKIALLHIDGNHDYQQVRQDYEAWRPFMVAGGWIVLDDYVWSHGDGPQRLGDEVLRNEQGLIKQSFVSEHALFIQYQ
jgi:hypothetical protein